jgi:hypothetical protein
MLNNRSTIIFLGIFIAISLSSSELYYGDERIIQNSDTYDHILASISALNAIKSGIFPIRLAAGLVDGLGYPFHQFYSPLTHSIIATLSLFNGNIFTGLSLSTILMMTLAFIFSFKLIKYISFDNVYALTGAFIFVCAPYLTINRVERGAYAEYFAICLLPCFLYYILRTINRFKIINCCLSIIILAILYNIHLITSFYMLVFSNLFLILHSIFVVKKYIKNKKIGIIKRLFRRIIILFSILLCSLLLSAWSIIPIIFYTNLTIKYNFSNFFQNNILTTILSLLSLTNAPLHGIIYSKSIHIQTGFLLNIGLLLLILKNYKNFCSVYLYPLLITQICILFLIISPMSSNLNVPFILSFAQFPYRFIAQYQLLGIIISILAFKSIIDDIKIQKNRYILKHVFSIGIIVLSLVLIIPYLYLKQFSNNYPIYKTIDQLKDIKMLNHFPITGYQFKDPNITPNIVLTDYNFFVTSKQVINLHNQIFTAKLDNYSSKDNYMGILDFDIMYYPGLQNITIFIDGKPIIEPSLSFYKRPYGISHIETNEIYYIYGLRVNNLPKVGIITVQVIFEGSHIGNVISVISLIIVSVLLLISIYLEYKNTLNIKFLNKKRN